MTETEIVQRIQTGEIDLYAHIVKKYSHVIYSIIFSKLFNKEDVDDLVQNTFLNFYKHIDNFDSSRPVLPYLYQIAKNEMKMYFRAHKPTLTLDEKIEIPQPEEDSHEEELEAMLEQLSTEQKNALQWLYEGYSYKEIATRLEKPLNTVKTLIRRARLHIFKQYTDEKKS